MKKIIKFPLFIFVSLFMMAAMPVITRADDRLSTNHSYNCSDYSSVRFEATKEGSGGYAYVKINGDQKSISPGNSVSLPSSGTFEVWAGGGMMGSWKTADFYGVKRAPAHTHNYQWVTDRAATCTTEGQKHKHCQNSGCSAPDVEYTAIPKTAHDFSNTSDNSSIKAYASTTAKAQYWNKCANCSAHASSGSYYHEVGYPLVKYSSGVPTSKTYVYGDTVTLTATFTNAKSYQWYKDGSSMGSSYRSATLNLGKQTSPSLSGKYKCIATGYNGNTGLNTATTATST